MKWRVYADTYDNDTDFANGTKSVRFQFTQNNILKYVRTSIILYNDPGLTTLNAKICYDKADESCGDTFATSSTSYTKAQITTSLNAVVEIYFEFNEIALPSDAYYHFVLYGTSSGFSPSSNLAWKTSYPDPVYKDGVSITFSNLPKFPYTFVAIGAKF